MSFKLILWNFYLLRVINGNYFTAAASIRSTF